MKITYRPDIDGLRAIAVLAVLFFHTEVPGFGGGFVGVDVFFVISGYLITLTIKKDIDQGNFSIARFYEKRIRRIFPALFPVMMTAFIVSFFLFDADALKHFGRSILATILFYSNILFRDESGYFAAPALKKPLLHTWSLSVEEQFYIIYPAALLLISRLFKGRYIAILVIFIISSLSLCIYNTYHDQSSAFYLVDTRAWEFLCGSIIALGIIRPPSSGTINNLLSVTGAGLLLYSISYYAETTLFPGYSAIAPVMGASMIIYCGSNGYSPIINKFLKWNPLGFIGLISYSLYLWHWPFVSITKYMILRPLNIYDRISIIAVSFIVSILSWKFIEQPFRGKAPLLPNRKRLFATAGIIMSVFAMIGIMTANKAVSHLQGLVYGSNNAYNLKIEKATSGLEDESEYQEIIKDANKIIPPIIGKEHASPSFILWGDSHAYALKESVSEASKIYNLSGYLANYTLCPPVLGIDMTSTPINEAFVNQKTILFIKRNPGIKTVIIAGRWSIYCVGSGVIRDAEANNMNKTDSEILRIGLFRTVHALLEMGRNVVIVRDVPEVGYDVNRYFWLSKRFPSLNDYNQMRPTVLDYNKRNAEANKIIEQIALLPNVSVVYPENLLFDKTGRVIMDANNQLLYRDDNHLSKDGSRYVSSVFDQVFKKISKNM